MELRRFFGFGERPTAPRAIASRPEDYGWTIAVLDAQRDIKPWSVEAPIQGWCAPLAVCRASGFQLALTQKPSPRKSE